MSVRILCVSIAAASLLASPSPAAGQVQGSVSVGYSAITIPTLETPDFTVFEGFGISGVGGSVSVNVTKWLALVAEGGRHQATVGFLDTSGFAADLYDVTDRITTFQGGVRLSTLIEGGQYGLFTQVLFGRLNKTIGAAGGAITSSADTMLPGIGIDVAIRSCDCASGFKATLSG